MGKPTDLSVLEYNRFASSPGVRALKREIRVFGFDSETGADGNIIVLAASDGSYSLGDVWGDSLKFLTKPIYHGAFNFFFNLGFDHNALFRSVCGFDGLEELRRCGRTMISRGDASYILDYIPGKVLKIKKGGQTWQYYDISKFYKGGVSGKLTDVYKSVFGTEYSKLMDASLGFSVIDEDVIKYCIEDAQACQRLSENLVLPTNRLVPMSRWYSGATIAKNLRKQNLTKKYSFRPNRLQQFAMNAYGGARIEVFQRGGWGIFDNQKLYMYDIRSAYPSVQCDLIETGGGYTDSRPEYIPEATHSFFRISVKIEDCLIGPLKYRFGNAIFYPVGQVVDVWVDKNELELLMEYDVRFSIKDAAHECSRSDYRPYEYLRSMYDERIRCKRSKDISERQLEFPYKLALNSSYGMLIERTAKYSFLKNYTAEQQANEDNFVFSQGEDSLLAVASWKAGAFFNPVHACEVTSAIRCKLFRDSEPYQSHLVKFATDSITFDKRIRLDIGPDLGQYEDSLEYSGIVIGCGVYSLFGEGKKVNKFRSFGSVDLMDLAAQNGERAMVEIVKKAPVKLLEAKREKYRWFNTFQEKRKELDINFDHRRTWFPEKMRDFNHLMRGQYESVPLKVETLC
jgi:hypothetical protein